MSPFYAPGPRPSVIKVTTALTVDLRCATRGRSCFAARLLRDNLSEMSATITMVICSRGGLMIVALRQRMQGLSWLSPSVNQDDVLIVARVGGRPGPRLRSIAVRRR
jgi:hypothetical protein